MKDLYRAEVRVTGGRDGRARSSDGHLDVALTLPTALGGAGTATNPEQLFAAGYGGCFASSVKFAARSQNITLDSVVVDVAVTVGVDAEGRYGLKAELAVTAPGLAVEAGDAVLREAKRICAYTNATKGQVPASYTINGVPFHG